MSDMMIVEMLDEARDQLKFLEPGTLEYKNQIECIKVLNDMLREREKAADVEDEAKQKADPKQKRREWFNEYIARYLVPAAVSILQIILIKDYENKGNFITTKAFSFLQKPKV